MEITTNQIVLIKEALKEFDAEVIEVVVGDKMQTKRIPVKLPVELSHRLGKLEDVVAPIFRRYKIEENKLIVDKHGVKSDEKGNFTVPPENLGAYFKDLKILLEQKEEINISFTLDMFKGVSVSKEFFIAMGDLVVE